MVSGDDGSRIWPIETTFASRNRPRSIEVSLALGLISLRKYGPALMALLGGDRPDIQELPMASLGGHLGTRDGHRLLPARRGRG
jgi:hypothetical protein